ncbi:ATP-binding protein, partial [Candidatus Binatus sp.]|uniref:ATP-binding protein n=1 Tax=Candidatus Binatus sp. TaxID=2811406 RepID=UPI003CAA0C96
GAGHMPPYLAGREEEKTEFSRLLSQTTIYENMILTGRRGVGKTVLLDTLKPLAIAKGWLWVGTDLSEAASISEDNLALRLLTDLSVVTSTVIVGSKERQRSGFKAETNKVEYTLSFQFLFTVYTETPGLVADKIKAVLEFVWQCLAPLNTRGIIFAYDEAQNLSDHAEKDQFPLSLLLDVFQSIQKKNIPFMLALTGLPNLFPKLVDARTFAERMFRVVQIDRLQEGASRDAILKPIQDAKCPINLSDEFVVIIVEMSGGYPYFIQFICREVYDVVIQKMSAGQTPAVPINEITRKLDTDFFAGRWSKATDRQRDLLVVIASLENCDSEFTVQEVVEESKKTASKQFSASHASQMLASLCDVGLVFKSRYGRYSLGVPLLAKFILRWSLQN